MGKSGSCNNLKTSCSILMKLATWIDCRVDIMHIILLCMLNINFGCYGNLKLPLVTIGDIVNFPFLDGDVPRSASYGVYISQLIRFARVSSHVDDFNTRNKVLTAKLLRQGYRYHKLRKAFSKFYRRHFDIVSKYDVGLKTLLLQGLSESQFYGDLVYKFRKIFGKNDFPYHFKKIVVRYKKIGYNINVMRQTACLIVNPIKVNSFAYLFNCTTVGRTSD